MNLSVPRKIVLIGASTGGPGQIEKIISSIEPLEDTTIIIAQHMVKGFLESFVKRLQQHSKNNVIFIEDGMELLSSNIYVCSAQVEITKIASNLIFHKRPSHENSYNPEISAIFKSFIPFTNNFTILCSILTGIGEDGVNECRELSLKGVRCITESSSSAIVDGMPSRARKNVPNIEVLDMDNIVNQIKEFSS